VLSIAHGNGGYEFIASPYITISYSSKHDNGTNEKM
jgi:hypothetical protein